MISPEELARMDARERARLLRALVALDRQDPAADPRNRVRRMRLLTFLVCCCVFLIPWIAFLVLTLPRHYTAGHWQAAWTGFDVALLIALAATAWAIWLKRQVAIIAALVSGTLLCCDAWFDMTLSWGRPDFWLSVLTALLGELPLAGLMFFVAHRLLRFTVRIAVAHIGHEGPTPPLHRIRLFTLIEDDEPETIS